MKNPQHTPFLLKLSAVLFTLLAFAASAFSQITKIEGTVKDFETGQPLPFVNISFKTTTIGTVTDIDGMYTLETAFPTDTLQASFVGYQTDYEAVIKGEKQEINFLIMKDIISLEEAVILPGENPAEILLRKIIARKKYHNKERLDYYEYEVYNKVQFDINNFDEKFKDRKIFRPFKFVFENIDTSTVNGKVFLPVFITETVSDYVFRKNPRTTKEHIKASKISGIEDQSISQFMGEMYQNINVYDNFVSVFGKGFVSPIADFGLQYYRYYLVDSFFVDNKWAYKIQFTPRRKYELTFKGEFTVHDTSFALLKVDMNVSEKANVNFINELYINQEFNTVQDTTWMLTHDRLFADFIISDRAMGLFGTKNTSYRNFKINQPRSDKFYSNPENISVEKNAEERSEEFWKQNRHDSLSEKEKTIYFIADTVKNLPAFKSWLNVFTTIVTGYKKAGPFEIGPYASLVSFNRVEGWRFGIGFKTNNKFSKKLKLNGHIAYGLRDQKWKYGGGFRVFVSKRPRQIFSAQYEYDIEQLGLSADAYSEDNIIASFYRRRPFYKLSYVQDVRANYEIEWFHGFSNRISFVHRELQSATGKVVYNFASDVYPDHRIVSSEVRLYTRFAYQEKFIEGELNRLSLGTKYPKIAFEYAYGIKGMWNGQFNYHRVLFTIEDWVQTNPIGWFEYFVQAGKTWGNLPYPLLAIHTGNETYSYDDYSFNMMNLIEFVSDEYVAVFATHHFNGYFLSKIPLMRRLKWRELVSAKAVAGRISQANENMMLFPTDLYALNGVYAEAGIGVENIFKILRVDVLWRLTQLDNPNIQKIGIRGSFRFNF
ncbi:MAG: hypothetical protein POELPBGB_01712 [Bacteroidia bacterium]|nr:hypothetical protein [Bacteroidia bacterium]